MKLSNLLSIASLTSLLLTNAEQTPFSKKLTFNPHCRKHNELFHFFYPKNKEICTIDLSSNYFLESNFIRNNADRIYLETKFSNKGYFPLSISKFQELKKISEGISNLTNNVLLNIIENNSTSHSWIEDRYGEVKHLWKGGKDGVNVMRIDYAWDKEDNFKVLELNTASQGGWTRTRIFEKINLSNNQIATLAPNPSFYLNYLITKLGRRIAIIVSTENYNDELDWIVERINDLGNEAKIIILSKDNIKNIKEFSPTGLFIKGLASWVNRAEFLTELSKLNLPQLPSFEAMFISGDKSFLEILSEHDTTGSIPKTYTLSKTDLNRNINLINRENAVLKPGELAMGKGVIFGKYFTDEEWVEKIKSTMKSPNLWVIQDLCYLKRTEDGNYQDVAVYLVDGLVKGVVSRVSPDEVVNIRKVGRFQWVVLERDGSETFQEQIEIQSFF